MRTLLAFFLLGVVAASADTIIDTYGQNQSGCSYYGPHYGSCDVVGTPADYDIQSASLTMNGTKATLNLIFSYGASAAAHGAATLAPFTDAGVTLNVGDVLFYDPSDPNANYLARGIDAYPAYKYGLALTSHDGVTAGDLYKIGNGVTTQISEDILKRPDLLYRFLQPVWLAATAGVTPTSAGSLAVNEYRGSANFYTSDEPLLSVTAVFETPAIGFLYNNQVGMTFSAATCGNDVIDGVFQFGPQGDVTNTPEPPPGVLLGAGICLIAAAGFARRRRASSRT
jgi:hypothetical protein